MLTDVFRVMINNQFKKNFYGKRKKKVTNILIVFSISYKSVVKIFLNELLIIALRAPVSIIKF